VKPPSKKPRRRRTRLERLCDAIAAADPTHPPTARALEAHRRALRRVIGAINKQLRAVGRGRAPALPWPQLELSLASPKASASRTGT
jgi:hypothetical protein